MKTIRSVALASLFALVSCTKEQTATVPTTAKEQTHCPVSGEKLGSMGEPVVVTHEGTSVKPCCDGCIEKFEKDSAKYVAKLKE